LKRIAQKASITKKRSRGVDKALLSGAKWGHARAFRSVGNPDLAGSSSTIWHAALPGRAGAVHFLEIIDVLPALFVAPRRTAININKKQEM